MEALLKGKVALVTGAASGIGRAAALAFVREGAKVVVADVNVAGGRETVGLIEAASGEAIFVETDVSDEVQVKKLVKTAVSTYGRLDCAHNNAGIFGGWYSVADSSEADWQRVINTNLEGVWLCMKHEIRYMRKHGGGAIVNTASIAGLRGGPGQPFYVTAKHAVIGLTRTTAISHAPLGIRVNAICPGFIQTPLFEEADVGAAEPGAGPISMIPMGRIGAPEEVAEAVVWLCSDKASYVTGHAMAVDGGYLAF